MITMSFGDKFDSYSLLKTLKSQFKFDRYQYFDNIKFFVLIFISVYQILNDNR